MTYAMIIKQSNLILIRLNGQQVAYIPLGDIEDKLE